VTIPPAVLTLSEVLDTFNLEQVNAEFFVGGHIAAQALMAASRTVSERLPHSTHLYSLRRGDARHPVDFEVTALHDGGTFSARRVTARQFGAVLLEGIASFSARALDLVDPSPPRIRMWWRPNGIPPSDPILADCLAVYVSGRTLLESAMIARRTTPLGPGYSALMDHAVWFHRPPDLSDWLLYEQHSPSGIAGRGLAQGAMYNRTGQLVCTTTLEGYFSKG
jgi:acyl-CoA thioesterase-2